MAAREVEIRGLRQACNQGVHPVKVLTHFEIAENKKKTFASDGSTENKLAASKPTAVIAQFTTILAPFPAWSD
jgi:hypothetical protein